MSLSYILIRYQPMQALVHFYVFIGEVLPFTIWQCYFIKHDRQWRWQLPCCFTTLASYDVVIVLQPLALKMVFSAFNPYIIQCCEHSKLHRDNKWIYYLGTKWWLIPINLNLIRTFWSQYISRQLLLGVPDDAAWLHFIYTLYVFEWLIVKYSCEISLVCSC